MKKTVFEDLSKNLTEAERKELYNKISKSMSFYNEPSENIYHKDIDEESRKNLIREDINRLTWFQKLILNLKRFFTGRTEKDLIVSLRIKELKNEIRHKGRDLTGFENRTIYPGLGEKVYNLYVSIYPLVKIYDKLWSDVESFEILVKSLIEQKIENPRRDLEDIISLDEMEKIFSDTGEKSSIKNIAVKKLSDYIKQIPEKVFSEVEAELLPVYYIKSLVNFPFRSFFELFHISQVENDPVDKPILQKTSAVLCLDYFEKIYYSLYLCNKISAGINLDPFLLNFIADFFKYREDEAERYSEKNITVYFRDAVKASLRLSNQVPFEAIIRYFKNDPYYQLVFYSPKLKLREFYGTISKVRIANQIDDKYNEIKLKVINEKINTLFKNITMENFFYYREYKSFDYKKMGLPFFAHTWSLKLIYNFIKFIYKDFIQELVQILGQEVLLNNKITFNKLLYHATNIEDTEDKIKAFDLSLSNDEEEGKNFLKLRFSIAQDSSLHKAYRALILQKDNEVNTLMDKGLESLSGFRALINELLNSNSPAIKIQFKTNYIINNKAYVLEKYMKECYVLMDTVVRILEQVIDIEKGRLN